MELELWMSYTDAECNNRKKNNVSAKLKSRPRQILLGNFLVTFTILRNFSESEPIVQLKLKLFWHIFTILKLHLLVRVL